MRAKVSILLLAAGVLSGQPRINEASGVFRAGRSLLVVDDSDIGAYFRIRIPKSPAYFVLNTARPERVRLRSPGLGVDLESVDMLADGRVVLLSERLRSLVGDRGIVAEYDSETAETGKRGLEGVAVRPLPRKVSKVAVLWEGGYPDYGAMPQRGGGQQAGRAWRPFVLIHEIASGAVAGRIRLSAGKVVELEVPLPAGEEPQAQRFRAPDLVWHALAAEPSEDKHWGFIVLLSSQSGVVPPSFEHHWLMRFDSAGCPIGAPVNIDALAPEAARGANWEGLAWFEPGKSLVLVHEAGNRTQPAGAMIVEIPDDWRAR